MGNVKLIDILVKLFRSLLKHCLVHLLRFHSQLYDFLIIPAYNGGNRYKDK